MDDIHAVSPLLDNMTIGECIGSRHGVSCYIIHHTPSGQDFVLKHISVPESEEQIQALLFSGAYSSKDDARKYYKRVAAGIISEMETGKRFADCRNFLIFDQYQVEAKKDSLGYEIYAVTNRLQSLDSFLNHSPMTNLRAVNLGIDLCSALSALREAGFLHQNIKPENVYLDDTAFLLGDLGLAPLQDMQYASMPEQYIGPYTAPELHDILAGLNQTADIYSVGMLLYRIYNGNHAPFEDEQTTAKIAENMRVSGTELPAPIYADYELAEIILKACAFNPERRYQHPSEFKQALEYYMQRNHISDTLIVPPIISDVEPIIEPADSSGEPAPVRFADVSKLDEEFIRNFSPDMDSRNTDSAKPDEKRPECAESGPENAPAEYSPFVSAPAELPYELPSDIVSERDVPFGDGADAALEEPSEPGAAITESGSISGGTDSLSVVGESPENTVGEAAEEPKSIPEENCEPANEALDAGLRERVPIPEAVSDDLKLHIPDLAADDVPGNDSTFIISPEIACKPLSEIAEDQSKGNPSFVIATDDSSTAVLENIEAASAPDDGISFVSDNLPETGSPGGALPFVSENLPDAAPAAPFEISSDSESIASSPDAAVPDETALARSILEYSGSDEEPADDQFDIKAFETPAERDFLYGPDAVIGSNDADSLSVEHTLDSMIASAQSSDSHRDSGSKTVFETPESVSSKQDATHEDNKGSGKRTGIWAAIIIASILIVAAAVFIFINPFRESSNAVPVESSSAAVSTSLDTQQTEEPKPQEISVDEFRAASVSADTVELVLSSAADCGSVFVKCSDSSGGTCEVKPFENSLSFNGLESGSQYVFTVYSEDPSCIVTGSSSLTVSTCRILTIQSIEVSDGILPGSVTVSVLPEEGSFNTESISLRVSSGAVETTYDISDGSLSLDSLVQGAEYSFTLFAPEGLMLSGCTETKFTPVLSVSASSPVLQSLADGTAVIEWFCAENPPENWSITCVNPEGDIVYNEQTNKCSVEISGISAGTSYTVTISAAGLYEPLQCAIPANYVSVSSMTLESGEDGTRVSWDCSASADSVLWTLTYFPAGNEQSANTVTTEEQSYVLTDLLPDTVYTFRLNTESCPLFGSTELTEVSYNAEHVNYCGISDSNVSVRTYLTPDGEDWDQDDISEEKDAFGKNERILFMAECAKTGKYIWNISVLYVVRDENGVPVSSEKHEYIWNDKWNRNRNAVYAFYDTLESVPESPGSYRIDIYFSKYYTKLSSISADNGYFPYMLLGTSGIFTVS